MSEDLFMGATTLHDSVVVDTTVWKAQDGRRIALVDMADSHLKNTLRFIQRKQAEDALLDTKGDAAVIAQVAERIRKVWETAMLAEAARRGLVIE